MKHLPVFFAMSVGLALSVHPLQAEDLSAAGPEISESPVEGEGNPEGNVEEELPLPDGGQEGEITQRGVPRIKIPGVSGAQNPRPKINISPKTKLRSI